MEEKSGKNVLLLDIVNARYCKCCLHKAYQTMLLELDMFEVTLFSFGALLEENTETYNYLFYIFKKIKKGKMKD